MTGKYEFQAGIKEGAFLLRSIKGRAASVVVANTIPRANARREILV